MMCSEPFVVFEHDVGPVDVDPLFALVVDEFDLMLNFRRLRPCECDELESAAGMNFKPTIISPRYVVTSSNGSLCFKFDGVDQTIKKDDKLLLAYPLL